MSAADGRKSYGPEQIRKFFEIIQRAGRLKTAEDNLTNNGVEIHIDADKLEHLVREVNDALDKLQKTDPKFVEYILDGKTKSPGVFKGSPDCPC